MRSICLFFQVHQPFRYRRYRFFDIGNDHYYYDDYSNETIMRSTALASYLPTNELLLKLVDQLEGKFKVAFSITGVALEQFELYAPEVIESFRKLAKTGCVEFLAETYSHTLASLYDEVEFKEQVALHSERIFGLFGHRPRVFRNTEMIYSDEIGEQLAEMGYAAMLTEGARHVLGWKSPNFLYVNARNPKLKVLMRNFKLSDDIAFRFSDQNWSEYPLSAGKYVNWLKNLNDIEEVVNLFLGYESFGKTNKEESGIFAFMETLAKQIVKSKSLQFATPSELVEQHQPVSRVDVPHPISWADEERDLSAWLGNDMQKEATSKLYGLKPQMAKISDPDLIKDWNYLQTSNHFYFMSTKQSSDGKVHQSLSPFDSPYEAFVNYMNVLSDFKLRLNAVAPGNKKEEEIAALHKLVKSKDKKIKKMEAELIRVQKAKKKKGGITGKR